MVQKIYLPNHAASAVETAKMAAIVNVPVNAAGTLVLVRKAAYPRVMVTVGKGVMEDIWVSL